MSEVSVRELRDDGGSVLERVLEGELITITKAGHPVAELRPVGRPPLPAARLLQRWQQVPAINAAGLRRDLDGLLDAAL